MPAGTGPLYATLVANTVTTYTLDGDCDRVEVLNMDGVAAVYFRAGGTDPAIDAAGSHVIPATIGAKEIPILTNNPTTVVKVISAGTPKVAVGPA